MSTVIAEWPASSKELDKLFAAQAKALGCLKNAPRTSKSHFGMYADLATLIDTIRGPLAEQGLSFSQTFFPYDDSQDVLITTLAHDSGQFLRSYTRIKSTLPPQQYAATATYMKRVSLSAIVGVAAEDEDDGETAERAAAVSKVEDESRVERLGLNKIREAKSASERAEVLAKALARVSDGTLSKDALARMKAAAAEIDGAAATTGPKQDRKQMASAT